MENNEENKFVEDRHYKIRVGNEYCIRRRDVEYEGRTISNYYIPCIKTLGGVKYYFNKKVRFKNEVSLKDKTKILIKNMFEDVFENKKDKSNPIWNLFILDFEIIEEPDDVNDAILDYQNNVKNMEIDKEREENDFLSF